MEIIDGFVKNVNFTVFMLGRLLSGKPSTSRNYSETSQIALDTIQYSQKQQSMLQIQKAKLEQSTQMLRTVQHRLTMSQRRFQEAERMRAREKFEYEKIKKQNEERFHQTMELLKIKRLKVTN